MIVVVVRIGQQTVVSNDVNITRGATTALMVPYADVVSYPGTNAIFRRSLRSTDTLDSTHRT